MWLKSFRVFNGDKAANFAVADVAQAFQPRFWRLQCQFRNSGWSPRTADEVAYS